MESAGVSIVNIAKCTVSCFRTEKITFSVYGTGDYCTYQFLDNSGNTVSTTVFKSSMLLI